MQAQFDFVITQGPDGLFQVNLLLVQSDLELGLELVGDHARGDRAKHLAILAGFDGDEASQLGNALGQLGHGIELVGFAFRAALLERFEPALIGASQRNRQALREEKVAGVTGCDLDLVGLAAQAHDVMSKNDFSFCHVSKTLCAMRGAEIRNQVVAAPPRQPPDSYYLKWDVVFFDRRRLGFA